MFRFRLKTAAALAGLGLLCGCTSMNPSPCGEQREGFFSRMMSGFHGRPKDQCECVETGRVTTVGEGPIVPEPGCCAGRRHPGIPRDGYSLDGLPLDGLPRDGPIRP